MTSSLDLEIPAKCKNVDRLMNFPIAPVFGCKQLFLVRPLTQAASIIEVGMQSKHYIIDNDHCMCCGNVVEGKIDLFTNIAVGRWLHL